MESAGPARSYWQRPEHASRSTTDRRKNTLASWQTRFAGATARRACTAPDVGARFQVDRMIEGVQVDLGPIDILVANPGMYQAGCHLAEELSQESWDRTLDVNLKGVLHCSLGVIPEMKKPRRGHIVLISSASALVGEPFEAGYAVSKVGVIILGRSLARNLCQYGGDHELCLTGLDPH